MTSLASTLRPNSALPQGGDALERWFSPYGDQVIGHLQTFESPFGPQRIVYADWTASGRAYRPIEYRLQEEVLPFFGNTHTGSTVTGGRMTGAYEQSRHRIKAHVHAGEEDALLFCGSGTTSAVNKLQRMIGLKTAAITPLVLVTHMEHHSNHLSWLETGATVEVIRPDEDGNVDLGHVRELLHRYRGRPLKIAAITACSNVTGIRTPIHEIAALMHAHGGICVVDFAAAAPYVPIDMHPGSGDLDAIYFSVHKFLGGPGTPGVLVFNKRLCVNPVPDQPGGGTVFYTNPWGGRLYVNDIEQREDGGTPPILQAIKAGFCVQLKEEMGMTRMLAREKEILQTVFDRLSGVPGVTLLAGGQRNRLGIVSFLTPYVHYNLFVKLLNDRFGVQARGGCSCAGTYGHVLLGIDKTRSYQIRTALEKGDLSAKPGWVRLSFHPIMSDAEVDYILDAVEMTATYHAQWGSDYRYDATLNEFVFSV
ncbi:aminotransferase class V-fold PLP-dependent enzyme [Dinghuibacter silviterrae]|uniref:Selenocysteine lyase/cysteine desulfurase n=1 Tax=Dinghuibacter silviterrae TaxID=1539049 RepID=A0A4R8DF77_9BACT|nr:aminotransferase class V-fold PLP-dependent enzyme [Dinghuibacter silviterrae]TDW96243.1 selenocysteine lyase/cysteine desulfurase [Dinghuibacter silviterrae]